MFKIVLLRLVIIFARLINLTYYFLSLALEKIGKKPNWTEELGQYFNITSTKVNQLIKQKRLQAAKLWTRKKRNTESQIHAFYQETDYFIFRQKFFHRHKAYLDLALPLLLKKKGSLCEYGGGIGPMTKWQIKYFPNWQYTIVDLDCPVIKFAKWRFKNFSQVNFLTITTAKLPLTKKYDVILCMHVLEHVSDPLSVVKHLVSHLKLNGWLFLNFIYDPGRENLISAARQRNKVLSYLKKHLKPVFSINPDNEDDGYGLYYKSR